MTTTAETGSALRLHDPSVRGFASDNYSGDHPEVLAALAEANGLAANEGESEDVIECFKQVIELASAIEARPLLGLAREALGRFLAPSGRMTDSQEELFRAISLFDRSNDSSTGKC